MSRPSSFRSFRTVLAEEVASTLRQPMLWTLVAVVVLLAWGMSTGSVKLGTGAATVGGRQAWITSEFSNAFIFAVTAASFYSFFVAIAAAGALVRDDEAGLAEILRSTPLSPAARAWGKACGLALAFGLVLAIQVGASIVANHLLPNPAAELIRGPLSLAAYLRPALLFAAPTLVFFGGVSFYLGVRTRRPALSFLVPLGILSACFSLLWNWSPPGLSPAVDRLLQVLDPSGFRWLNETWLKLDRGAEFYNTARVGLDGTWLANRLLALGLGLAGIFGAVRSLARERSRSAGRSQGRSQGAVTAPAPLPAAGALVAEPLPKVRQGAPGAVATALAVARVEAGALLRHPGVYLFAFFILLQALSNSLLTRGAFQTALILTPGQVAAGAFNTLSLLLCLLIMLFFVESLERERTAGVAALIDSGPTPAASLLAGKILGVAAVFLLILLASWLGGTVAILTQGKVFPTPVPYLLLWGLLLVPTLLAWTALLAAVHAASESRAITYGAGLGLLTFTLYCAFTDHLDWVGNWLLWNVVSWSDIAPLALDRQALLLNRLEVLAGGALCAALAVALRIRRRPDLVRLVSRLGPEVFFSWARRVAPVAVPLLALPLLFGGVLGWEVLTGRGGAEAREEAKRYWRQNVATWKDAPQPAIRRVDVALRLEPEAGAFETRGTFELANPHAEPLARFALTGGRHWRDVSWTLDGRPYEPEDRSGLYVFTPPEPLAPSPDGTPGNGGGVTLGFSFSGRFPDGVSENGGSLSEFIIPQAVVLTSFRPTFVPTVGYDEDRGVDDDNRTDPPDYPADLYRQVLAPLIGSATLFPVRMTVDAPQDFLVHGVGVLAEEKVAAGRRIRVWQSDHPVAFFNVIGGRWQEKKGEGTAVFYFPQHAFNVEEMSRTLDAARRHYSEWFAPYPWEELKLSEFPSLAVYAQGFATNITFSEGVGFLTRADEETDAVFMVTAHETAHQWWGNLLRPGKGPGSAILAEGMAHYSTLLLLEAEKGDQGRMEFAKRIEEQYGDTRRSDAERSLVRTDYSQPGDRTVIYDKGGWAFWMLDQAMGREAMLAGLRGFIATWQDGPDFPLLEDFLEHMRPFAPDPQAFDRVAETWFYDVVVPEYRLREGRVETLEDGFRVWVTVENHGTGRLPVEVAAVSGKRFGKEGLGAGESWRESRVEIELGAGESRRVEIRTDFEPEKVIVDPDVQVLQLRREHGEVEL